MSERRKRKVWTQEEESLLAEVFPVATKKELEEIFDRNYDTIYKKGKSLNLKRRPQNLSLEEAREVFLSNGCILLEDEYINNSTKMSYICKCGKQDAMTLGNMMSGKHCKECGYEKTSDKQTYLLEDIKKVFEKHGCLLISEEYKNSYFDLEYRCPEGHLCVTTLQKFQLLDENKCTQCTGKKQHTIESAKAVFLDNGCKLIEEKYINAHIPMKYICKCGEESYMTLSNAKSEKHCYECRSVKLSIANSGENSSRWNSSLTEEDRVDRRLIEGYTEWVYNIYRKDGFKCTICGSKKDGLNAHHKDGYHWCLERRLDLSNGVTLCVIHHKEFHSTYGARNNTEEQWIEYYNAQTKERSAIMSE